MTVRNARPGILPLVTLVGSFLFIPTPDWRERLAIAVYVTEATKVVVEAINHCIDNWRKGS